MSSNRKSPAHVLGFQKIKNFHPACLKILPSSFSSACSSNRNLRVGITDAKKCFDAIYRLPIENQLWQLFSGERTTETRAGRFGGFETNATRYAGP